MIESILREFDRNSKVTSLDGNKSILNMPLSANNSLPAERNLICSFIAQYCGSGLSFRLNGNFELS
jgi:hypothetical protein